MSNQNYVNLIANGLAFMNRFRWVQSQNGDYLALSLNSWHGKDGKDKTLFEAIPKGDLVLNILQDLMDQYPEVVEGHQGDKITVTCGFVVSGLKPDYYNDKNGKSVDFIRCNLIKIKWIKVNGEYFYREADEDNQGYDQGYHAEQEPIPEPPRRQAANGNNRNSGNYSDQQSRQAPPRQAQRQQGTPNGQNASRQPTQGRGGQRGGNNRQGAHAGRRYY